KILQPPRRETVSKWDEFAMTALYPSPLLILATAGMDLAYWRTPIWQLIEKYAAAIVLLLVCGLLSSIAAWKLAPRFSGAPAEWGWLVFIFFMGLPGLVGYLMHFRRRIRPMLEPATRLGTEIMA
ncbi:MAG: hypothetical protein JWN70_6862, partial [Planctomycetaceae bacterium]|nr:hypothetical protein [Planctomycetaceae bacterium]